MLYENNKKNDKAQLNFLCNCFERKGGKLITQLRKY
jgi:hypothetical protein